MSKFTRVRWGLLAVFSLIFMLIYMAQLHASANADTIEQVPVTVSGTPTTTPASATLTIYDNNTAQHHTRTIEYFQHDGYSKTENLVGPGRKYGVILKQEDIENACKSNPDDGSLNPVGGYNIHCGGVLVNGPTNYPLGGDLIGRFCRVPQKGYSLPCPLNIHVNEDATGQGQYLQVGNKDHGAMEEIDYYVNNHGQDVYVDVKIPVQVEITRIVLLPAGSAAPSAVLVYN